MRINENFPYWEGWSEGYAAFTVDSDSVERVRQYVMNQREHHTHASLEQELDALLKQHGIFVD